MITGFFKNYSLFFQKKGERPFFLFGRKERTKEKSGNGGFRKWNAPIFLIFIIQSVFFLVLFLFSKEKEQEKRYTTTAESTSPMGLRIVSAASASCGVAVRLMTARSRPWK